MQQLVRHFGQTAVASSVGLSTFASKQKRDTTDRPTDGSRVEYCGTSSAEAEAE